MTCIAWDGRVLAADRAAWSGNFKYRVRKVHRIEKSAEFGDCLVGVAGDGGFAMALLAWWAGKGKDPGPYPERLDRPLVIALVVTRSKRVFKVDSALHQVRVYGRLHAIGGGQEMAIGAMAAGADARHAVKIVLRHSDVAGLGVDAVSF